MMLSIRSIGFAALVACCGLQNSQASVVSFLVDPATIDNNPVDGNITGTEFSPVGSDGTVFTLMPTNNLVGADRFLLSPVNGISFGGGSGSTLSFDFTPNANIQLESYVIGGGLSLNNPVFDIREGLNILSLGNAGDTSGNFTNGPIQLQSGATYSFVVTNFGAGIQRQMASWNYTTAIPEPSTYGLLCVAGLSAFVYRRRKKGTTS